ncbi:hypothetical protein ACLB2K_074431 [Fragaria x ananassa]
MSEENPGGLLTAAKTREKYLRDPKVGRHLRSNKSNAGGVSELLAISDRFGWDNDDKVGWSKVNFKLLGTSKGGRILRRRNESESEVGEESEREREKKKKKKKKKKGSEGLGEKRRERREEGGVGKEEDKVGIVEKVGGSFGDGVGLERSRKENGDEDNWVGDNSKKFLGRESLLRKAYSRRYL